LDIDRPTGADYAWNAAQGNSSGLSGIEKEVADIKQVILTLANLPTNSEELEEKAMFDNAFVEVNKEAMEHTVKSLEEADRKLSRVWQAQQAFLARSRSCDAKDSAVWFEAWRMIGLALE
jgi:hypothetical protein